MIKPYIQRIRPYPLCQPTLTYSKEGKSFRANATSDLLDVIQWSVNSTDTDLRNEVREGCFNDDECTVSSSVYVVDNDEMFVK